MSQFQFISVEDAHAKLAAGEAVYVDIRDAQSFAQGHVPNSQHLSNANLSEFMAATDPEQPIIVGCYHGNSSQGAAQFLVEQGFDTVYSMNGGFAAWSLRYPVESL